jgi:hypothetical protein
VIASNSGSGLNQMFATRAFARAGEVRWNDDVQSLLPFSFLLSRNA